MTRSVAVTFDYRCPFARNAHEALIAAQRGDADLDVRYLAFSLDQIHVEEGQPAMWDRPDDERGSGILPLTWGVAVRDTQPDHFLDFHEALFAIRHDQGERFTPDTVRAAAEKAGVDVEATATEIATGRPLATVAAEHTEAVARWAVFGVPTFCVDDEAVFVRFMERGRIDDLDRALGLLDWTRLNEFKRTRIPR